MVFSLKTNIAKIPRRQIIVGLFLLSLFSGYFWNHRFFWRPVPPGDEAQYSCIAENIIKNHIYTNCGHIISREPGYPFFIAAIYWLSNFNPDAVRLAQLVIFALINVLIFLLADKLFNRPTALAAGLFSALWWGLANYTGRFTREILLAFLLLLLVFALLRAVERQSNKYFFLAGLILGLLALIHGLMYYLPWLIILNLFIVFRKKLNWRAWALKIILLTLAFALIISPWLVRNKLSQTSGAPLAGFMLAYKAQLSEALYPQIYKYYFGHLFGYYFAEKIWPDLDLLLFKRNQAVEIKKGLLAKGYSEQAADKIMKKKAIKNILSAPQKYAAVCLLHFLDLNSPLIPQRLFGGNSFAHFTFAQGRFARVPDWAKTIILLAFRFFWLSFLFLAFYGMFKNIKHWPVFGWLALLIFYFNAAYSAVYAIPRYLTPVMPFYIIFAAAGFNLLMQQRKLKTQKVRN